MFKFQERFVKVYEYFNGRRPEGILTAIPTLDDPNEDTVHFNYDIIKFKKNSATIITCNFNTRYQSLPEALRLINEYIQSNPPCVVNENENFITAIPIYDRNVDDDSAPKRILAVKHEAVDPLGVRDEELSKFDPLLYTDPARAMNAANSYAKSIGYAAGISTCNRNSDNNWVVYGIKEGYAEKDSLNAYDVNHYINFSYNGSIDENYQLLKAHELITDSIGSCSELTSEMLQNLRNTYRDTNVVHKQWDDERPEGCDDPVVEGCARVGDIYIWINFERINRTNNPNKELAQILIHEMMHVAGYSHPKDRNDPDYQTSAPVLASKCIQ